MKDRLQSDAQSQTLPHEVVATVEYESRMGVASREFLRLSRVLGLAVIFDDFWITDERSLESVAALGEVLAGYRSRGYESAVVRFGDVLLFAMLAGSDLTVSVAADHKDRVTVDETVRALKALIPLAAPPNTVAVRFWSEDRRTGGGTAITRNLAAPSWTDVRDNYPTLTKSAIEAILSDFSPESSGQLILWRGKPGTGKTTAIRSLAQSWKGWCEIDLITDPDAFFQHSQYMTHALLAEPTAKDAWRLLIFEDSGELLVADAKAREGHRLSRLLNLVDGLIGQGLRILTLLTTNEELAALHPAVARPGRCASLIEFQPFDRDEALNWFAARGSDHLPTTGMTLAEMFATLSGRAVHAKGQRLVGFQRESPAHVVFQ